MKSTAYKAQTIAEVIEILQRIIDDCIKNQSPLGYFAALYQKATLKVQSQMGSGYFEDDERMEKLDVTFANRYFEAYRLYTSQQNPTLVWELAFKNAPQKHYIVLQHLLFGMNAHINLDLGIAAAEISTPQNIESLKADFYKINRLLSDMLLTVQTDLAEIWLPLKLLLRWLGNIDNLLSGFSMQAARNGAWKFALALSNSPLVQWNTVIKERDRDIVEIASKITQLPRWMNFIIKLISWSEKGNVAQKIRYMID